MAYKNLREFIRRLDAAGELIRIKAYVNPRLEMAEITDRFSKSPGGGKALLFENTGYDFPVLMNAYGSERRMCMALGVEHLDDTTKEIESLFHLLTSPREGIMDKLGMLPKLSQFASWMPKVIRGRGACQEMVASEPDLGRLPVIQCWPEDGGPFLTLPVIHTKDIKTGTRNVGMYRMQVFGPTLTGMHWHKHKVSARHFAGYKQAGKRMPVAVALGGDPVYAYSATAPLPENVDEYMLAGFLRKKRVELVRCLTQPELEVPADVDFVIEGYVDPQEDLIWEGPFGDHTGYYSLPDWYPRFHVTAITHRRDAVYPATIVGIPPQEDAWLGKATERIFLAPIKMTLVPEIIDMDMPVEGVFHNLVIAQINKEYAGQGRKVMSAMWGAGQMMFNKILVLTDEGAGVRDYEALARYALSNAHMARDVAFSSGPMDVLDHSCSKLGFGGKMCFDGTAKSPEEVDERFVSAPAPRAWSAGGVPGVQAVNETLLSKGIPCLIVAVKKERPGQVRELHEQICAHPETDGIKLILYVEHTVDPADLGVALWRCCNNLDPERDHMLFERRGLATMGLDGTIKTKTLDGFGRDWPNIIVADSGTIAAVDAKWESLGAGPFLSSPSLRFKNQMYGKAAVAAKNE